MGHQVKTTEDRVLIKDGNKPSIEFVLIVMRVHLFPSRTQKLSSCTPTILGGRLPGKIGNANTKPRSKGRGFFLPKSVHRTLFIRQDNTLAYPESQVTRTQEPPTKVGGFFLLKHATSMFLNARTIHGLPGKPGNANTKPPTYVGGFSCWFLFSLIFSLSVFSFFERTMI